MKGRNLTLWLVALLVLMVVNVLTFQREHLAANGQIVFLELRPVDPRSHYHVISNDIDYALDVFSRVLK